MAEFIGQPPSKKNKPLPLPSGKKEPYSGRKKYILPAAIIAGSTAIAGAAVATIISLNHGIQPKTESNGDSPLAPIVQTVEASGNTPPAGITVETEQRIQTDKATYDYFNEVVMHREYAGPQMTPVFKWEINPTIKIHGSPTEQDMQIVRETIGELNSFQNEITLSLVTDDAESGNIDVYFVPRSHFKDYDKTDDSLVPGSLGWNTINIDVENDPFGEKKLPPKGLVLIASDIPQDARIHTIKEEISQDLGPSNDSDTYPDSMWRQTPPHPIKFSGIDKKVIGLLYNPLIKTGMTPSQVDKIITVVN